MISRRSNNKLLSILSACFYREYRNVLDPLTWPRFFNPTDNGDWISKDSWYFKRYQLIDPAICQGSCRNNLKNEHGNTHSLGHYLFNPLVHLQIFKKTINVENVKGLIQERKSFLEEYGVELYFEKNTR